MIMVHRQRLIVCLDGTWNNRDNNTNVLHHFSLVREGRVEDPDGNIFFQRKYYHPGVGTGLLDGISGGGFGFGLEKNVRDAYNWLVQFFRDDANGRDADEIYIFGFSRGAYTARSLVGFIGRCGLLRRGAPETVTQLWEDYCLLGRQAEERRGIWEVLFGDTPSRVRPINDLVCDPWQISRFERDRLPRPDDDNDRIPGQRENGLTPAEKLLVRWSRRVRITYLGVYDTVGAIGYDALAIPGLKSKIALHNNMRPTALIQKCRHALAMDENRSSFSHTPFVAYLGHESVGEEEECEHLHGGQAFTEETKWDRIRAMWRRKIQQRWFVGAHSNVGGGYPDNRLAQRPFFWLFEGAEHAGMVSEPWSHPPAISNALPTVRDSYAEFAAPFWTTFFRAKRFYRQPDPAADFRAGNAKKNRPPYLLENINESVDDTVFEYWRNRTRPPNLAEYAVRRLGESSDINGNDPSHPWLGCDIGAYAGVALWAIFATVGLSATNRFLLAQTNSLPFLALCLMALTFVLIDWGESRVNFSLATGSTHPRGRAFRAGIYWTRAIGVLLFGFGVGVAIVQLWKAGWNTEHTLQVWPRSFAVIQKWWMIPIFAGAGVILSNAFDRSAWTRFKASLIGTLGGIVGAFALCPALMLAGCLTAHVWAAAFGPLVTKPGTIPELAGFAGLLLLLQFAALCLLQTFAWTGEPMRRVNLSSIVRLQFCLTPAQVTRQLKAWCRSIVCPSHHGPVKPQKSCAVDVPARESLWRDIIGLIPVYFIVLTFGLWFAARPLKWSFLDGEFLGMRWWVLIPLIAVVADYLEDLFQLGYLRAHAQHKSPNAVAVFLSFTMSMVKFAAFLPALALTIGALAKASWTILLAPGDTGWRGALALTASCAGVLFVICAIVAIIGYRGYSAVDQTRRKFSRSSAPQRAALSLPQEKGSAT
jgi:uncharacterized protein (DUF2235 family)